MDASSLFADIRLVPVLVIDEAATAVPLAQTLFDSGVRAMEITLRTSAGLPAIEAVAKAFPEMIVGAGSIREAGQIRAVRDAGGRFLVSPGSSPTILAEVEAVKLPFVPGAVTATEMMCLMDLGYQLLKFFPAELSGGLAKLKAIAQPLPEVKYFPTGGITAALAPEYLAMPAVACIGGSWFVPGEALAKRDFAAIGVLTSAAVAITHG